MPSSGSGTGGGGLNLKWTSVDEEARQWRRAQRAARKAQAAAGPPKYHSSRRFNHHHARSLSRSASPDSSTSNTHKTSHHGHSFYAKDKDDDTNSKRHPLEDEFNAHHLAPETLEQIRIEIEEARFRSKLFDAMEDDQRLDMLEASFNAHIPARWSSSPGAGPSTSSNTTTSATDAEANSIDPSLL